MPDEIFLPLEVEQYLLLGERIVFVVSSLLHIVALFCLIKETPPHQTVIRSYLLIIQATVIATDVYFCVLFEPFPVLQMFAGYCVGILCKYLQATIVVGIYAALVALMGVAIIICALNRHQTIVMRGRWFLTKRTRSILNWFIHIIYCGPCLVFAGFPFNRLESENLIEKSSPDVRWMRSRGGYFMLERSILPLAFIAILINLLLLTFGLAISIFAHMFVTLHRESGRSLKLKRVVKISLIRLFVQINIPILFVLVPLMILMIEIPLECFSFEFCLGTIFIVPFHPLVHNVILIIIVPEYRSYILKLLCRLIGKRCVTRISSVHPSESVQPRIR